MLKSKLSRLGLGVLSLIYCLSAWANLPTPPPDDVPSGSSDWIDVANTLGQKAGNIFLILLGAALLGGIVAGVLKSYHVAQERQETSHFFKAVGVGVIAAALGLGLLYSGYDIING